MNNVLPVLFTPPPPPPHFFRLLTKFSFLFAALSALLTVSCPNPQDDSSVSSKTFTITNTGEWNSAIEAVKNGGDNRSYTLVIDGTVSVPGTDGSAFGAGVSVTVQGSGELALASPGRIFTLGAGQTLILGETGGSGPTLRGLAFDRVYSGNNAPTVYVNGGEFTMTGGTITGNYGKGDGGGVYVDSGTFTMNGGTISDNDSKGGNDAKFMNGGGVYVNSGTFTMNGGTITGNTGKDGSGVYVNGGEFTMTGGTITRNGSTGGNGGGVYVKGGTFTMTGGTIRSNSIGNSYLELYSHLVVYGGGVYVGYGSTFTKSGGSIISNYWPRDSSGNGTQVYYNASPPKYCNSTLEEDDDISTADLETNWEN